MRLDIDTYERVVQECFEPGANFEDISLRMLFSRRKTQQHFVECVIPFIKEGYTEHLLAQLSALIRNENGIPDKRKSALLQLAHEDTLVDFLAETLKFSFYLGNRKEAVAKPPPDLHIVPDQPIQKSQGKNRAKDEKGESIYATLVDFVARNMKIIVIVALLLLLAGSAVLFISLFFQVGLIFESSFLIIGLGVFLLTTTQMPSKLRLTIAILLEITIGAVLVILGRDTQTGLLSPLGAMFLAVGGAAPLLSLLYWISVRSPALLDIIIRFMTGIKWTLIAACILLIPAIYLIPHFMGFSFIGRNVEYIEIENAHYDQALTEWTHKNYGATEENFVLAKAELEPARGRQAQLELAQFQQKLGALYIEMGRYEESYELLNSAYTTFYKMLGRRHTLTTLAQGQIALYDLGVGNYERAIAQLKQAFEDSRKGNAKIQISLMLAQAYMQREDYSAANEAYGRLVEVYHALGLAPLEVNPMLASEYGSLMMAIGDYDSAHTCFQMVISYWEQNNGEDTPLIATVFSNMAALCDETGKAQEAVEYADKAVAIYEKYHSGGLDLASKLQVIGGIYDGIGELEKALEYLTKALEITLAEVGENHRHTAAIYRSLALHYSNAGDIDEAVQFNERAVEILIAILQGNSSDAAIAYNNLSDTYTQAGRYEEAIEAAEQGIAVCLSNTNSNPATLGNLYIIVAWPYLYNDQLNQAFECVEKGYDILANQFDDTSATMAWATLSKGRMYANLGRFEEAEEYMNRALEINILLFGEDHERTVFNMGRIEKMNEMREAVKQASAQ